MHQTDVRNCWDIIEECGHGVASPNDYRDQARKGKAVSVSRTGGMAYLSRSIVPLFSVAANAKQAKLYGCWCTNAAARG